ncbi:DNA replication/repair protein RecF [Vulcaniibacterium tengchongense]|uniref:DNA replication and repair protein RecF n=1 Tax=Vulcaniibacterium tengchongense TaxID=1273429 RepID=A0A3N4W224_9GAMM|nr:DNA replication/repair protein RecF [Vulcaniibacterium tengchongense]RPE80120.1 DNA replication and repair protein RecF [Vulcaniibacterium tengchongense]
MHVTRLELRGLRRFAALRLAPAPGLNLITGDNGAGKTSVLEALHLMAYGRSFRGRVRDGLIRSGDPALEVFVEWRERAAAAAVPEIADADGSPLRTRRAGLRHTGQAWTGRLDGSDVASLGELCAALAVITFEPGSHALITGGGEARRRYLDWGLFHVEHGFLPLWRRYVRALKQRNALLKARARDAQLDAWDRELAEAGEPLSRWRERYLDELQPRFAAVLAQLAPALGAAELEYLPGWRRDEWPLGDALLLARERDLAAGYTSVGPHRADWRIRFAALPGREALSRGQAKLTALAALLTQAEHHAAVRGEWPVVALDDLASELDRHHQGRVLQRLRGCQAQVFITGTEAPAALADAEVARFHVEHGSVIG